MKTFVILFSFIPFICFAQSNQQAQAEKPAADACPTWNKKSKSASKAEYFQFLRSNKAKDSNHQNTYAVNPGRSTYSITKTTNAEPRTARGRKARSNALIATVNEETEKEKAISKVKEEEPVEKVKTTTNEKEMALSEEKIPVADKEKMMSEAHIEEKAALNEEVPKTEEKQSIKNETKNKKETASVNTEKLKHETKVATKKVKRFFTRKNKGRKGKAAKCPDF